MGAHIGERGLYVETGVWGGSKKVRAGGRADGSDFCILYNLMPNDVFLLHIYPGNITCLFCMSFALLHSPKLF